MSPPAVVALMAFDAADAEMVLLSSVALTLFAVDDMDTPVVPPLIEELSIWKMVSSAPDPDVSETPVVNPSMSALVNKAFVPATEIPVGPVPWRNTVPKSA